MKGNDLEWNGFNSLISTVQSQKKTIDKLNSINSELAKKVEDFDARAEKIVSENDSLRYQLKLAELERINLSIENVELKIKDLANEYNEMLAAFENEKENLKTRKGELEDLLKDLRKFGKFAK